MGLLNGIISAITGRGFVKKDFAPKALGDIIPDETMREMCRRFIFRVEPNVGNDEIKSEEAPQDKTKLWRKPSTGQLFGWDEGESDWIEIFSDANIPVMVERFDIDITADGSGNAVANVVLTRFTDLRAGITVMFKEDAGATARWWITGQSEVSIDLAFAGLTASTTYSISIQAHRASV